MGRKEENIGCCLRDNFIGKLNTYSEPVADVTVNCHIESSGSGLQLLMSTASSHPRLVETCDWRTLPLEPTEAFILSRIDGVTPVPDLAVATGLPEPMVRQKLERLESLGAIVFAQEPGRRSPSNGSGTGARTNAPPSGSVPPSSSVPPAARISSEIPVNEKAHAPSYDAALLDAPGDLPRETKREILEMDSRLARVNHYELLGVPRRAEKAEIKKAYFELVNRFHTDRFFGKELGEFRSKLEKIFTALTKAHDTLSRKKSRTEYDRYLASREATFGARDSVVPRAKATPSPEAGPEEASPTIPRAPKSPSMEAQPTPSMRRPPDPGATRRLLARKLDGLRGTRRASSSPPPSATQDDIRRAATDDFKRRYAARAGAPAQQKARYLEMAERAERDGHWGSALNALKLAATMDPEDQNLRVHIEKTQERADRALADKFLEQAVYEEKDGHYERAARSYERAARGKRSAEYFWKSSFCLQKDGSNVRKAVEMARMAVQLDPAKARYHSTLANAFSKVGMTTSALAEVTRALELDPEDAEALRMRKALK